MERKAVFPLAVALTALLLFSSTSLVMANDQPTAQSFRTYENILDRENDISSAPNTVIDKFSVYVKDNDGVLGASEGIQNENGIENVHLYLQDNNGALVQSFYFEGSADNAYLGDNLWVFENYISYTTDGDTIPDDNLGGWQIKVEVTDNTGYQDNIDYTRENTPYVVDFVLDIQTESHSTIDRKVGYSNSTTDNTMLTARVSLLGYPAQAENILYEVRDANDAFDDNKVATDANTTDENTVTFTWTYDASDDLPDDNLGLFDLQLSTDNTIEGQIIDGRKDYYSEFSVYDLDTTLSIPSDIINNETITVSGTANTIGHTSLTLDNARISDEYVGIKKGTTDGENWEVTFQVTDAPNVTSTLKAQILDDGSVIDGQVSDTYYVESGEVIGGPPVLPTEKAELLVNVSLGVMEDGDFVPKSSFSPGDTVTVRAKVTRDGDPVSGADVSATFKGSTVSMSPSGAGIYYGTFTVREGLAQGQYSVDVSASEGGQSDSDSDFISVEKLGISVQMLALVLVAILASVAFYYYYIKK